jgi:hypothetical protein
MRCVVPELDRALLHLAATFDVDVLRAVDQDVADRRILEDQFQRTETEGLVQNLLDQAFSLVAIEERLLRVAQVLDDQSDFAAKHVPFELANARQVELVDELAVNLPLELVEFVGLRRFGAALTGR